MSRPAEVAWVRKHLRMARLTLAGLIHYYH